MTEGDYYARQARHAPGDPFANAADAAHERQVAAAIERCWQCQLHAFAPYAALDWFATRDDMLRAVIECKARSHAHDRYPTVFLNVRKWLALQLAAIGLGVPAMFVVKFTDTVLWTPVGVEMGAVEIGGCARIVKSHADIEPVIEVPIEQMRALDGGER